jgi:poly(A) polymerase
VDAGYTAYLAGGCVRDFLLGLSPKDFDVATDALPEQVVKLFPGSQCVGAHFGVVVVRVGGGGWVEVATFRTDGSYSDGRRPERVEFATPEEDARRRDFSVNALFYDLGEGRVGVRCGVSVSQRRDEPRRLFRRTRSVRIGMRA